MPGPLVTSALIQGGVTLANGLMQQRAAAKNQEYNRQNMRENFRYSQEAQRNAAVNEVAGLKAAGLSPALANGAAAAPIANSSNGTAQAPSLDPANLLLMAQLHNVEAQTENTQAQTTKTEVETGRMKSADLNAQKNIDTFAGNMLSKIDEKKNPELYAIFETMRSQASTATVDTVRSTKEFMEMLDFGKSREARFAQYDYEMSLYESMLDKGVPDEVAKSFAMQNSKLGMEVTKMLADVVLAGSQAEVNEATIAEKAAHIQELLADANLKYSKDFVSQFKQGDAKAMLVNAAVHVLGLAGDTISASKKSKTAIEAMQRLKSIKVGPSK